MFGKLFSSLRASNNNDEFVAHRKHTRREHDHCIVIVNGNRNHREPPNESVEKVLRKVF